MCINVGANVTVAYHRGLPRITVPLPSRKEHCSFTMKPITHTVGNLLDMLKMEDRGIDRACITSLGETLFVDYLFNKSFRDTLLFVISREPNGPSLQ